MLFSSLALAVAAAVPVAVQWAGQQEVEEGEEHLRVLPVVALHSMHVERRDGYKHLPQTMKLK
jgi:hypothetical protein